MAAQSQLEVMELDRQQLGKIADQIRQQLTGKNAGASKHNIMAAILIAAAGFSVRHARETVPGSSNAAHRLPPAWSEGHIFCVETTMTHPPCPAGENLRKAAAPPRACAARLHMRAAEGLCVCLLQV